MYVVCIINYLRNHSILLKYFKRICIGYEEDKNDLTDKNKNIYNTYVSPMFVC